jgi:hypothetical protein
LPPTLALIALAQAALVFPQDGAIGLAPPPGMSVEADAAAFADPSRAARITLAELPPAAFATLARRLDAASGPLADGSVLDGAGEALRIDGRAARLYRGRQGDARTLLLLVSDDRRTAVVAARFPAERAIAIETALRGVRLRDPAAGIDALPFVIGDTAGYRLVRTLGREGAVLTEGPLDVDTDGAQPLAIVVAGRAEAGADRATFARSLFAASDGLTRITIAETAVSADGVDHRVTGTAVDRARYVALRQHLRFAADGRYLRTMCIHPVRDPLAERCDRLAASVAPR